MCEIAKRDTKDIFDKEVYNCTNIYKKTNLDKRKNN